MSAKPLVGIVESPCGSTRIGFSIIIYFVGRFKFIKADFRIICLSPPNLPVGPTFFNKNRGSFASLAIIMKIFCYPIIFFYNKVGLLLYKLAKEYRPEAFPIHRDQGTSYLSLSENSRPYHSPERPD